MSDKNQFSLLPIGRMLKEHEHDVIQVDSMYRKGLLHISEFSHLIIIYHNATDANIWNTQLCQKVVHLLHANEKEGTLYYRRY